MWDVEDAVPYNWLFEMFCIKFVPTSEWRVQLRTEECAERTWERDSGAPLVPQTLLIIISNGLVSLS